MEDFIAGRKRIEDSVVLPRQTHQHILKCHCDLKPNGWTKLTKQQLCEEIAKAFETTKVVAALWGMFYCCYVLWFEFFLVLTHAV